MNKRVDNMKLEDYKKIEFENVYQTFLKLVFKKTGLYNPYDYIKTGIDLKTEFELYQWLNSLDISENELIGLISNDPYYTDTYNIDDLINWYVDYKESTE